MLEFPGSVTIAPPQVPVLVMGPPIAGSDVIVLPVAGRQGMEGPQGAVGPIGPKGPPGDDSTARSFQQVVSSPSMDLQIIHGLSYKPSGIICTESDGFNMEYDVVTHPMPGVTELTFGVGFTGTVYLS